MNEPRKVHSIQRRVEIDAPTLRWALYRLDTVQGTVRYEWTDSQGRMCYGPAFVATVQEWARARG